MSTSTVLCHNLIFLNHSFPPSSAFAPKPKRLYGTVSRAENNNNNNSGGSTHSRRNNNNKKKNNSWWHKFFFQDNGNWLGLKEDEILDEDEDDEEGGERGTALSDEEKFEAWKQRAEAIVEIREAQEDRRNQEYRKWEDWLLDGASSWSEGFGEQEMAEDYFVKKEEEEEEERGLVESVRSLIFGRVDQDDDDDDDDGDDDILYEDRVFNYASTNSAKFLAVLIVIPWAMDFLVHDYALMPFLDRYVKKVPFAAQMLDVRRDQKLEIVKELKTEKARFELEVEIGKSPPLSDDEMWWELRHKALDLREEWRLENRRAFANIWSDAVYGISLFILLYFNKSKVALLKFTGYKIINNISDTGKAFLIILITDIFLGYHSESGWQTLIEIIVEHYGLEVDQDAITIFICLVPVVVDACVKLWLFKYLPRLSPNVSNIFEEMRRH